MLLESRRSALQRQFQEVDAPFISMLGKSAGQGGLSDPPRIPQCELRQDLRDSRTVGSHQNLSARLEELADALPRIGDDAGAGAGCLKNPGCGAVSVSRHAVAADIQYRACRCIEGVVITRIDMTEIGDVKRQRLVRPAIAAEHKPVLRQIGCPPKEELLDPPLAIRQAI